MAEVILPGSYVTVRDEGLITAGRVATGNIGIVGTASKGPIDEVIILGSFTEAREIFGVSDPLPGGSTRELTLIRALEYVYNNGGKTVYAVRTAGDSAAAAIFQLRDAGDVALAAVTARSKGTWGNEMTLEVAAAEGASVVTENLAGNASALNRSNIVPDALLNRVSIRRVNGTTQNYELLYTGSVVNTSPQVLINPTTGALTFATSFLPTAGDRIEARYEVPATNSKRVTIRYGGAEEAYTIADASHLAEQLNAVSTLVHTDEQAEDDFFNELPADTNGFEPFGTGLNGHTQGANGENADSSKYGGSAALLENEIVNIMLFAGQDASDAQMVTALGGHINTTSQIKRERIAIIGSDGSTNASTIAGHNLNSDRIIFVAPGIKVSNREVLPGAYTAAAVAGLISSLPVHTSPTNKVLTIPGLAVNFTSSQLEKLVLNRVFAIERRNGHRIVKGITTATNSAWHQVTTRRIVDYASYGVRSGCDPYIGKLNNERVRAAMKATLDAFLTRMVEDEALISYELEVSATRAQQIAGEAIVNMVIRPTFSIDFIKVTMYLA